MTLAAGTRLGWYEIVSPLGAGGMGEVYKARDTRLKRDVAIKVLPAAFARDPDRLARLQREAELLAALNHPNIAAVYGLEHSDRLTGIVLELVEGETLEERLHQASRGLALDDALAIARQIADALDAAHGRGIIHRDLKPANIKITPAGVVKLLDFGLAKVASGDTAANPSLSPTMTIGSTREGVIQGTAAYMSPEQARGKPVDKRTDIWAFGCVLYEMLTGRAPFAGDTISDMIAATLEREPDWQALPAKVPPKISQLVRRCLEKDAQRRMRDIGDARVELEDALAHPGAGLAIASRGGRRWLAVAAPVLLAAALFAAWRLLPVEGWGSLPGPIRSLAVLPLENLSGDPEQEYFAAGMTDALIGDLAKISALRVISRTSVMRYLKTDKSLPEIARELGVDGVIEGTVVREGDRIRVTAQLVDARSDSHVWADHFDRELSSVLALQSDVARAVTEQIRLELTPQDAALLGGGARVQPDAYDAYLKGRYLFHRTTHDDALKAVEYFQEAIRIDPDFAPGYAGLADAYS